MRKKYLDGDDALAEFRSPSQFDAMLFAKRLRQGIREGSIRSTVRIWHRPRVRVGGWYPMEEGHIVVESIRQISIADVTGELARQTGFEGVVDLLRTAKHGSGSNVYFIEFEYAGPSDAVAG
jgi:hypothetical protein